MLEAIFNPDNFVFCIINKIIDLAVLSLVWVLCCIPLVTIGPASAALYYAVVKSVRKQRSYPVREFFHAFCQNMKKGIAIHLILVLFGIMMFVTDVPLVLTFLDTGRKGNVFFLVLFAVKAVVYLGMICWLYPLLSRFEEGLLKLAEAALYLLLRNLPSTLLAILVLAVCAVLAAWEPLLLVLLPGGAALVISLVTEPGLCRICGAEEKEEKQEKDKWYLEK